MLRHLRPRLCTASPSKFNHGGFRHSVLPNGLQVLTQNDTSTTSTVALFTKSGTRYENDRNAGVCAILECLTFKGTALLPQPEFSTELIAVSAAIRTNNLKELMSWSVTVPRFGVEDAVDFMHGVALHPVASDAAFEDAKRNALERMAVADRDQTRLVFDYLHDAAYGGKGVGRTQLVPEEHLAGLTRADLERFVAATVQPQRACVVGLGIDDHDAFAKRLEQTLKWPQVSGESAEVECDEDLGFTGGIKMVYNDQAPETLSKFEEKNLTHIALAFKGVNAAHPDYYAYSVAQALLGGGMSFSSGGPGKGMHTKLFREVNHREGWVQAIECLTAWYSGCGFFGLYAMGPHEFAAPLLNVMMFQAASVAQRVSESDLEMAKNQFLSQLVLLSDARDIASDEAGKNLLLHRCVVTPQDLMREAEKVTLDDLRRCMGEMVQHKPALAVYGNSRELPQNIDDVWSRVKTMHRAEANKGMSRFKLGGAGGARR